MAAEDFGVQALGKPIEIISADHQMRADIGTQIGRAFTGQIGDRHRHARIDQARRRRSTSNARKR
jgi:hypothetical protein